MDFKQPYNSNKFVNFLNTFLPDDFEKTEENIELNDLSFNPNRIKNIKLIGNVSSLENLHIYEIYHESENDPKVTLSRETFRLMSNYGVKKALAAFTSRNSPNYRFSLVAIDLKLEGARVTREYSNPRRYSFYLGPAAKVHTPTEFLIKKGKIKDLKDLQNRFSVEVVTKAFFTELSNWYFWALKYVIFPKDAEKDKNGKNMAVIRLITRLIFIWFMKQKGLMPDYLFNEYEIKNILKDISPDKSTYYRAILQNLFFASLNTPQNERRFRTEKRFYKGYNPDFGDSGIYRYQSYFREPPNIIDYFNEIPFLNGGLFECLDRKEEKIYIDGFTDVKKNQPIVPNFLFFSKEKEVNLNKEYGTKEKRSIVRGLLSLLQLYNFTIDESTPVDIEIALDPELLGRVFENLLASYNPETATTARKATGSYYTPRAIVDYMVTQSLKEYFKTRLMDVADIDSKIDNILSYDSEENPFSDEETNTLIRLINELKIIDPAVGSGAFPMGILHKLVLVLSKLDPHNEKWKHKQISAIEKNVTDVTLKKELIEKVEQNFQKNELNYGRKLYLIQNCIYGVDIQPIATQIAKLRFFISLLVDEKIDKSQDTYDIEPLPNLETKFVTANSLIGLESQEILRSHDIINLENELRRVRDVYFSTSDTKKKEMLRKKDREIREKLAVLLKKSGFPSENTEKILGWDPYDSNRSASWFDPEWMFGVKGGFDIVIGNPPYVRQELFKDIKWQLKNVYSSFYNGRADLYTYFFKKGIDILRNGGILAFITSNKFFIRGYGINTRKLLIYDTTPKVIINFGELPVFKAAVDSAITILEKTTPLKSCCVKAVQIKKSIEINDLQKTLERKGISMGLSYLKPREWIFDTVEKIDLISKLRKNKDTLGKYCQNQIFAGIKTGLDAAFVIDEETKNALVEQDAKSSDIIRPWFKGKNITKWYSKMQGLYVIYIPLNKVSIHDYPVIENYLKKFKKKLESRATHQEWYEMQQPQERFTKLFDSPKIIYPDCAKEMRACYDMKQIYGTMAMYFIPYDPVILALLNSKLFDWYARMTFATFGDPWKGGRIIFKSMYMREVPIPLSINVSSDEISDIVSKILEIARSEDYVSSLNKKNRVYELVTEIDHLIFKLYGLTDEEIKIVEGHNK